jgi:hypothetical protein
MAMITENVIRVRFGLEENQFYLLMQKYCRDKGISMEEYIKNLIKRDLAWGHLSRRKK